MTCDACEADDSDSDVPAPTAQPEDTDSDSDSDAPAPTAQPEESCADSTSFWYDDESKDCSYVASKTRKRCKSKNTDEDGYSPLEACPESCGTCEEEEEEECEDSSSWFYKGKSKNNCGGRRGCFLGARRGAAFC